MRYIVFGWRTEIDRKSGSLGEIVSGHYSLFDAVKSALRYTSQKDWYECMVAKLLK